MIGVLGCPYCGGEVEVTRLADKGKEKQYRIQCLRCHALVAKGKKFPNESEKDGEQRIKEYEEYINQIWAPSNNKIFSQTITGQKRNKK